MKITDMFPKLLQAIYYNCTDDLKVDIQVESSKIMFKKGTAREETAFTIDDHTFYKCYAYLLDAKYIENFPNGLRSSKDIKLTSKAINFIEKYRPEF